MNTEEIVKRDDGLLSITSAIQSFKNMVIKKITLEKFCITCCFKKVFHLSNTFVINSESLLKRSNPDSTHAMVSKSTLHPLCLILAFFAEVADAHDDVVEAVEAAAAAAALEVPLVADTPRFLRLRDSLRLSILDSESCRVPTDGNQIDFTAA